MLQVRNSWDLPKNQSRNRGSSERKVVRQREVLLQKQLERMVWPDNKTFAFTIFDDTDGTTLQNGPPIYGFLHELGILTTKSIWPRSGSESAKFGGSTCDDVEYLRWAKDLQAKGFELALHNVTYHSSERRDIIAGLEQFRRYFGHYPRIHVNHAGCKDSLYWGEARLSGFNRFAYNLLTGWRHKGLFSGEVESSKYFWGDLSKEHVKYVRNFVYSDINTLKSCPAMPYHDPNRPYVNYWFASSEGADCKSFCRTLSEENQERLEIESGACIMYTHFGAKGFYDKSLNPHFEFLLRTLSRKNGWFVPVGTLLDHILSSRRNEDISDAQRNELELRWLGHKVFGTKGTS
jgi:hypothetical protein